MERTEANPSPEEQLFRVAEDQAGYFTTAQARKAGYSQRQLTYYAHTGRFRRVRWGIYRLALYPSSEHEDLFVAWLSAGPEAVLSHDTALVLYELSDTLPDRIHLTIPPTASRRKPKLAFHTSKIAAEDMTTVQGLPVTTVPRTIADVAASGLADELVVQAIQQAVERGLVTKKQLGRYLERRGGRVKGLGVRALGALST